jgi:hypothetical protein
LATVNNILGQEVSTTVDLLNFQEWLEDRVKLIRIQVNILVNFLVDSILGDMEDLVVQEVQEGQEVNILKKTQASILE